MKLREQIDSILEGRTNIGYGDVVKAQLVSLFEEYAKEKAMEIANKYIRVEKGTKINELVFDEDSFIIPVKAIRGEK